MKKLCIFDFDGTLVNTITDVAICFNEALIKFGFSDYPIELYDNFVGGNLENVVERLLTYHQKKSYTKEDIDKIKNYYLELYMASNKENTKPYDGIVELLRKLQKHHIQLAINTNKKQVLTEELTERFFSDIQFLKIIGYTSSFPSKPDPNGVFEILRLANLKPEEAVYIGDGLSDVKTAENAGIDCIFCDWGQGKGDDKNSPSVKFIVNTPQEIEKIIL